MKSLRTFLLATAVVAGLANAANARSIFVDNHAAPNGDGSAAHPFQSLAAAAQASEAGDEILVNESTDPYAEDITLKPQQKLSGQGAGATIRGTVTVTLENTIATCTIANDHGADIYGATSGALTLRDVHLRASPAGAALLLVQQAGPVTVTGGDLEGAGGNGISISAGAGAVVFEHFAIHGTFASAIAVSDRLVGGVTFKEDCEIRVDDATKDAIVFATLGPRALVRFDTNVTVHAHARGFVVFNVARLAMNTTGSTIAATNGAALDIRNSSGDFTFATVSAEGTFRDGLVIDHANGSVTIGSPKAGSGGTIHNATGHAIVVEASRNVHLGGITVSGKGLQLHDVDASTFEAIAVNGEAAVGAVIQEANDVTFTRCTFGGMEIRQQTKGGRVLLDRCAFSALDAAAAGTGKLALVVQGSELGDNALVSTARETGHLSVAVHSSKLSGSAVVDVRSADHGSACVDLSGNQLTGAFPIHLTAAPGTTFQVVGAVDRKMTKVEGTVAPATACE